MRPGRGLGFVVASSIALLALAASCGRDAADTTSRLHGPLDPDPGGFQRDLRLVLVTSNRASVAPGEHGLRIKTVVANDWSDPLPMPPVTLVFEDTAGIALPFEAREFKNPGIVGAGTSATVTFDVDAPPGLAASTTVRIEATSGSLTPPPPFSWTTPAILDLVVNTTTDEADSGTTGAVGGDGKRSLREAIYAANLASSSVRIRFDPLVFPAATVGTATITLAAGLSVLPVLDGSVHSALIDATGRGVVLRSPVAMRGNQLYAMHLKGRAYVFGLTFGGLEDLYPNDAGVSPSNDCAGGPHPGGAILMDGTAALIAHSLFDGAGVAERNCYAREIHVTGGTQHRIVDSVFINLPGDALLADAHVALVARNIITPGTDDGFVFDFFNSREVYITGNVVVGQDYSAIALFANDAGNIHVWNNTLLHNGKGLSNDAIYVGCAAGLSVDIRNNAFLSNYPADISVNGACPVTLDHDASYGSVFVTTNGTAMLTIDTATITTNLQLMLTATAGTSFAPFLPLPGSPLIDAGANLYDANGTAPGRFFGAAQDLGAVEAP